MTMNVLLLSTTARRLTTFHHHIKKPLLRSSSGILYSSITFFMFLSLATLPSSFSFHIPKASSSAASNLVVLRNKFSTTRVRFQSSTTVTKTTLQMQSEGQLNDSNDQQLRPNVAIIGAGAAGLVTARILSSKGFKTQIFEKEPSSSSSSSNNNNNSSSKINQGIGGVWSYTNNSKKKPMYKGLRTNLPRELMAYRSKKWGGDGTSMSFVTHGDVQQYLQEFMYENDLEKYIHFDSNISQLKVLNDEGNGDNKRSCIDDYPLIELEWESSSSSSSSSTNHKKQSQTFDAVCICNGHYSAPSSPPIQGLEAYFKGKVLHSIEYDDPKIFEDKTVLCIGGRASGSDLAREISHYANKVYLSDTSCPINDNDDGNPIVEDNVYWVPKTLFVDEKGIHFEKPCRECANDVDVIIFCSGYDYCFPFINDESNLELSVVPGERRVSPLFEQLWHAQYPNVAFVGLQHSVVPFPFFEFQAEAIAKQLMLKMGVDGNSNNYDDDEGELSQLLKVPISIEERMESAMRDANSGGPKENGRVQDTHFLGSYQWDACRTYAQYGGVLDKDVENHIATNQAIYDHSNKARKGLFPGGPDLYRYNSYIRDDENRSFSCTPVKIESTEVVH